MRTELIIVNETAHILRIYFVFVSSGPWRGGSGPDVNAFFCGNICFFINFSAKLL